MGVLLELRSEEQALSWRYLNRRRLGSHRRFLAEPWNRCLWQDRCEGRKRSGAKCITDGERYFTQTFSNSNKTFTFHHFRVVKLCPPRIRPADLDEKGCGSQGRAKFPFPVHNSSIFANKSFSASYPADLDEKGYGRKVEPNFLSPYITQVYSRTKVFPPHIRPIWTKRGTMADVPVRKKYVTLRKNFVTVREKNVPLRKKYVTLRKYFVTVREKMFLFATIMLPFAGVLLPFAKDMLPFAGTRLPLGD